ncbi:MAG: hypothetical protein ACFFDI_00970 [Promethearchaeota archaeon]
MKYTMGERLNIRFNRKIKLEFHGVRLTYVIFQMAEVAISKEIFAEIISRINRLRCYSMQ